MAPSASKASYKSYESQARMVRAIVAAHPEVKWNYKEIVACFGSDMTEHALNHRFRRLRAQAHIIRDARAQGFDIKNLSVADDLPAKIDDIDRQNIAKYFGQSTPDGIQFQFRAIKRDAEHLRKTEADGGDVAGCLTTGSPSTSLTTPSRRTTTAKGTGSRKRARRTKASSSPDDDEDDDDDMDDVMDEDGAYNWRNKSTASTPGKKNATPRRAAQKACATIANAAAQLRESDSPEIKLEPARTLFGPRDDDQQVNVGEGYGDGEI
ncbi:hypothetical protein CDD80_5392 [Ophiocordyceps camponoti-rufipedis]|uniref:Uncharacterized protein n=1 Tax=Ophiocordyceps camponoti-rufipedis TaxID=2004952 RepID=A0A2C5YUI3_9HYPO|nr:hypothetical protein CDD80_5392 [Ophiocordyceps camponoti-rufipedis]